MNPYEGIYFDNKAVTLAFEFIQQLTLTKGTLSGAPEKLTLLPYQKKLLANIIGWKRADDSRLVRRSYFSVARKNAKTQTLAALGLYLLFCDNELSPEIYVAAKDREQASLCYTAARDMILADEDLRSIAIVTDYKKTIANTLNNGVLKALSSDGGSKHGLNPSAVILDELHAWKEDELFAALTTGSGARRQPLQLVITTAGFDQASICYREYTYAKEVQENRRQDPAFFPLVYEAGPEDDWLSPETWRKANPGLDAIVRRDYLYEQVVTAQNVPSEENKVRRLHLNQWTSQESRWLPLHKWDKCGAFPDRALLKGRKAYCGLDLSGGGGDLTAFVMAFGMDDGTIVLDPYFWLPEKGLRDRVKSDKVNYDVWAERGLLDLCPGETIDYSQVRKKINELGETYNIRRIAADKYMAAQMIQELDSDGFEVVPFGQSYGWFSMPCKEFLRFVLDEQIQHGNNPIMRFMADSVTVEQDSEERIRPVKPKRFKTSKRIDGIVAALMGFDQWLRCHKTDRPSVYQSRGVLVL